MAIREDIHPARRFVNLFLLDMFRTGKTDCTIRSSDGLPALRAYPAPPDFERFANVLKVMAGLDPGPFPTPRGGSFLVAIDHEISGVWEEVTFCVHASFADAAGGAGAVNLHAEVTARTPTVDPDACL